MKNHRIVETLTPLLIYLNAAIWLGFSLLIALDLHPAIPDGGLYRWGMASLAMMTGILLIALYRLSHRARPAYFLLLGMLVMIALLTVLDEFGLADLAVLMATLLAAASLIVNRDDYLIYEAD